MRDSEKLDELIKQTKPAIDGKVGFVDDVMRSVADAKPKNRLFFRLAPAMIALAVVALAGSLALTQRSFDTSTPIQQANQAGEETNHVSFDESVMEGAGQEPVESTQPSPSPVALAAAQEEVAVVTTELESVYDELVELADEGDFDDDLLSTSRLFSDL